MASFLSRHLEPLSLLKKSAQLTATLVIACTAFVIYCFFTPSGTKTALQLLTQFTPYDIAFTEVTGCLATELSLENVTLKTPRFTLQAKYLQADWDWVDLLRQHTVKRILAKEAQITVLAAPQVATIAAPTSLDTRAIESTLGEVKTEIHKIPVPFKVTNLILENSTLHWKEQTHQIDKLVLFNTDTTKESLFQEIHYQGSAGTFDATIADTVNIHWNLTLTENPFFARYFSGKLTTAGHILFLKAQLDSPATKLNMRLAASKIYTGAYPLEDVSLTLQGTLAKHDAVLSGKVDGYPVKTAIYGQLAQQKWIAKLSNLTVTHQRWQKMGTTSGTLILDWSKKKLHATLDALLWDQYPVALNVQVQKSKPYALTGTLQSQVKEIKSLAPLLPDLKAWRAKCNIQLALSGTLLSPQVTGDIILKDVKLRHFAWGSKAVIQELHARLLPDKLLAIAGNGTWGSGPFTLKGDGNFNRDKTSFALSLKGENLLLSDTPEYYIVANPDLTLTFNNGEPQLRGTIVVPQAEIQSLKNPDMVTTSADVVIVSAQKPQAKAITERSFATLLTTNIEIILGDKISYKGHGFTTHAKGKLLLRQAPGQMPNAKGQINLVNGKYRAYGKTFDIDYGQIVFAGGPMNDPLLDIRAQRKIEPTSTLVSAKSQQTIVAGVKFVGNLKSPKIEFYSIPAMSDADVMSYLIVGRPQSEVNQAQGELLLQAVSQMISIMGNQREDVQLNLADKLKLDQFGFSKKANSTSNAGHHNPLEDTVFVLGKQLSERLYLHYSLGIVDSANNFGLRYMLGKNLTLEASTGTQGSSADVLLSFEGH